MKKLLLLLEHKIVKIGLIIVIVLVGFFLFMNKKSKKKLLMFLKVNSPLHLICFKLTKALRIK